jgi:hypothetical protein
MDKWDVGKVVSMQKMFFNARNFDKPIHLKWQGTAASTKQLHLLKDAKAFHAKYSCEDDTDGPLTSCTEVGASADIKTRSSKKASAEKEEASIPETKKSAVQTKEYDIQAFGKSMTAKLEYDEETGQVKGWIIDENAGKEAMLGQRKRGTWKFFKAADLGMAARGAENNFRSSIVYPAAGALVVLATVSAYRKQQQQKLFAAETKIMANDLESQSVASASKYGTLA